MLSTNFVRVGLSGKTTDGRTIKPEWLEQAASNYNTDIYTAQINYEHKTWAGNFGQILELKTEKENGKTALYARLRPNADLLHLNRQGEKLFTSMELRPKFADVKGAYLKGLAVTDDPASLGTQELRFSKEQEPQIYVSEAIDLEKFTEYQDSKNTPSVLKKIAHKLNLSSNHQKDDDEILALFTDIKVMLAELENNENDHLNKADANHLEKKFTTLEQSFNTIDEKVNQIKTALDEALKEVPPAEPRHHHSSSTDKPECF